MVGKNFTQSRASASSIGWAIFAYNNTVLCFNGINNFINNTVGFGGAISTFYNILCFVSVRPTTISNTQQIRVVDLSLHIILYLALVEPEILSTTYQLNTVELPVQYTILCLASVEPATLSITQHPTVVVQSSQILTIP